MVPLQLMNSKPAVLNSEIAIRSEFSPLKPSMFYTVVGGGTTALKELFVFKLQNHRVACLQKEYGRLLWFFCCSLFGCLGFFFF